MTPRPILFVDHANDLGGAEQSLLLLMTFLDHSLWQPHLLAPPGKLAEEAAQADIPVHSLDLPRLRGSSRSLLDWWYAAASISRTARVSALPSFTAIPCEQLLTRRWLPGSHHFPWCGTCKISGCPNQSLPPNGPIA